MNGREEQSPALLPVTEEASQSSKRSRTRMGLGMSDVRCSGPLILEAAVNDYQETMRRIFKAGRPAPAVASALALGWDKRPASAHADPSKLALEEKRAEQQS
jgi:hypothetical protein